MNMKKEERLESFFSNIAHTFFLEELNEQNYKYFMEVIPVYIKIQLDIEDVSFVFEDIPDNTFGRYIYSKKQVELSNSRFAYRGDDLVQNLKQIFDLLITSYHELYHALDFRAPKGDRHFLNQALALEHIIKFIPEHKEMYESIKNALYHNSRVETFARQGAANCAVKFIDKLKTYAKQNIQVTEKEQQEYELVKECVSARQNGEDFLYPQISENGRIFIEANIKMNVFDGLFEFEQKQEKQLTNLHCTNEMTYGHIVNKDLETISEKILNGEIQVGETELVDITESQLHNIFYNETTAHNLRQYALTTKDDYIIYSVEDRLDYAKSKHNICKKNHHNIDSTNEKNTI